MSGTWIMSQTNIMRLWGAPTFCPLIFSSHKPFPPPGFEELGCVSTLRYQEAVRVRDSLQDALAALEALALSTDNWRKKLPDMRMSEAKYTTLTWVTLMWNHQCKDADLPNWACLVFDFKMQSAVVNFWSWLLLCGFFFSGGNMLQYKDVSFEMLASAFPECLSPYMEFSQRLKIEGKNWYLTFWGNRER